MADETIRIAAVADIHHGRGPDEELRALLKTASSEADVLLLCGDLTDYGTRAEAEGLAALLRTEAKVPVLAVLGNHDFESGTPEVVREELEREGVTLLDGECAVVGGVGFAGASGFGGGFGDRMLSPWGEPIIKQFVQHTVDEAFKLERALSTLDAEKKVVLLHYAPVRATVEGEPVEIHAFLGSSRLAEPLDRFGAVVAFHGHAHHGSHEGRTGGDVPVYNVSKPVLKKAFPERPPVMILEV